MKYQDDRQKKEKKTGFKPPIKLGPVSSVYLTAFILLGGPSALWVVEIIHGKPPFIHFLGTVLPGTLLFVIYMKDRILFLNKDGIRQGYPLFRKSIAYDKISGVSAKERSSRGGPVKILVISEASTSRQIVIPIASFDPYKLDVMIRLMAHEAPQAHIEWPLTQ